MKILLKIFILLVIICSPSTALALFVPSINEMPNLNMKPTLTLTVDPQTPLPNSIISVIANLSAITNVNNSNFSWFINGVAQKEKSGVNKNIFTFQVGSLGTVYKIGINILTPGGDNISDSISFTVSDFDLTWDANSQAPAPYKGKLLPTQNSVVGVSALPFVYQPGTKALISSANLAYNWYIDDKFSTGKSGLGKSNLIITMNNYAGGSKSIRLEIKTSDGGASLSKGIDVPIAKPQVFVYIVDSKTGFPYGSALKNLIVSPISLNFIAQNYFFNATPDNLRWRWLIDGKEVASEGRAPWLASLNLVDTGSLFTQIQTIVKNSSNELEVSQSIINLEVK